MQLRDFLNLEKYRGYLLRKLSDNARLTYAQAGEDSIVAFALRSLRIRKPLYLDIGAYDPVELSNTYYFYREGARGILVEPNPLLCEKIRAIRPGDICIEAGIGPTTQNHADFYLMEDAALSTFSKESMEKYVSLGMRYIETKKIPLYSIEQLIKDYCKRVPDIISLDTEGMDENILKHFDFNKYRPAVFIVETMMLDEKQKNLVIAELFEHNGYFIFADTYVNTIFIEKKLWEEKKYERIFASKTGH